MAIQIGRALRVAEVDAFKNLIVPYSYPWLFLYTLPTLPDVETELDQIYNSRTVGIIINFRRSLTTDNGSHAVSTSRKTSITLTASRTGIVRTFRLYRTVEGLSGNSFKTVAQGTVSGLSGTGDIKLRQGASYTRGQNITSPNLSYKKSKNLITV